MRATHHRVAAGLIALALAACSSKTAEEKGAALATAKLDMATGIGNALQTKGAQAGESVADGVGTVIHGVERGIMKSGRVIVSDPTLAVAGLAITKVQDAAGGEEAGAGRRRALDAYVVSHSSASGVLRAIVFDAMNNEIGRAHLNLVRGADEAKYETLPFDAQVDLSSVRKVRFVFKPADAGQGTAG